MPSRKSARLAESAVDGSEADDADVSVSGDETAAAAADASVSDGEKEAAEADASVSGDGTETAEADDHADGGIDEAPYHEKDVQQQAMVSSCFITCLFYVGLTIRVVVLDQGDVNVEFIAVLQGLHAGQFSVQDATV